MNQGTDGNFYGTCASGGASNNGSVYQETASGTFKLLYSFTNGTDSQFPNGPPIMATDGNLYGTDGTNTAAGIVYKLTTAGTLTILHSFSSSDPAGYGPSAPLVQGSDGSLYGTTQFGAGGHGAVFKISTAGALTLLHAFSGTDGDPPIAALVQGSDSNFYGSTYQGGTSNLGVLYKITSTGTYTVLHNFSGASDGSGPEWALVQASDGNYYGVTCCGQSSSNAGTIFKLTGRGVYSVVYDFPATGTLGTTPNSALIQDTNGLLYGVTSNGGTGSGELFSLNIGANPFAN